MTNKGKLTDEELFEMDQDKIIHVICNRHGNPTFMSPVEIANILSRYSQEELKAALEKEEDYEIW